VIIISVWPAWSDKNPPDAAATITVINQRTGFRRTAESEPGGAYAVTSLEPGDYTLEVWAPDRSPKWQPLPYSIRAGQLAHVDCLPP